MWQDWYIMSSYGYIIELLDQALHTQYSYLVRDKICRSIQSKVTSIWKRYKKSRKSLMKLCGCRSHENKISSEMCSKYADRSLEWIILGYLRPYIDTDIAYPEFPCSDNLMFLSCFDRLFLGIPSIVELWRFIHILIFRFS